MVRPHPTVECVSRDAFEDFVRTAIEHTPNADIKALRNSLEGIDPNKTKSRQRAFDLGLLMGWFCRDWNIFLVPDNNEEDE